jgi:hypothetical protein
MKVIRAVVLLSLLALPAQALGQGVVRNNVVSANPFLLIAEWFNGEFEHKISAGGTLGVRGSTIKLDDDVGDVRYLNARGFYRYYPRAAFEGFYFGLDGGITSLDEQDTNETHMVFAGGFELGYNWLLGARKKLYLSLGAGADRLFGSDLEGVTLVIPTVRIVQIGIAF